VYTFEYTSQKEEGFFTRMGAYQLLRLADYHSITAELDRSARDLTRDCDRKKEKGKRKTLQNIPGHVTYTVCAMVRYTSTFELVEVWPPALRA
jgi:hypothetical protein